MTRLRTRATPAERLRAVEDAIAALRQARGYAALAGATQTYRRVCLAISSAKGARRHAELRRYRT